MQVHTFRQHIRCNDDVVLHRLAVKVCIKILLDGLPQTVAVGCRNHQNIGTTDFLCKSIVQIIQCIHAL